MAPEHERKPVVDQMIEHLRQTWGERSCLWCQGDDWSVGDDVFELRKYAGGGLMVGGAPVVPVVPVTCNKCGNTVLINAIVGSVMSSEGEKKE